MTCRNSLDQPARQPGNRSTVIGAANGRPSLLSPAASSPYLSGPPRFLQQPGSQRLRIVVTLAPGNTKTAQVHCMAPGRTGVNSDHGYYVIRTSPVVQHLWASSNLHFQAVRACRCRGAEYIHYGRSAVAPPVIHACLTCHTFVRLAASRWKVPEERGRPSYCGGKFVFFTLSKCSTSRGFLNFSAIPLTLSV
jgi:hypothetical protein